MFHEEGESKMKKRILQLLVLSVLIALAMNTSLMATDYTVSGAGSSQVNGTYVEDGNYNGKPQYRLGSTDYILDNNPCFLNDTEV